jgi:hypothetical protein
MIQSSCELVGSIASLSWGTANDRTVLSIEMTSTGNDSATSDHHGARAGDPPASEGAMGDSRTAQRTARPDALDVLGHQVGDRRLVGGSPPSALWRRRVL